MKQFGAVVVAVVSTIATTFTVLVATTTNAAADGCPTGQTSVTTSYGTICVTVSDPGSHGSSTGGTTSTTGTAVCLHDGGEIPCVTGAGIWFSSRQCYAQEMNPQPPVTNTELWVGHTPVEGSIWVCSSTDGGTGAKYFFVSHQETPPTVDPGDLAQTAERQLPLTEPVVHTAPEAPLLTYVNLATWLWMNPTDYNTLQVTVSAGPTSVMVSAAPTRATWDLTDGTRTCTSPGRAWVRGMRSAATTDCSYTFTHTSDYQPGKQFPITATISYQVDWTCTGACSVASGTLGELTGPAGTSAITVGERQSVVTESH